VHDNEFSLRITPVSSESVAIGVILPVRMTVEWSWLTVSSPSSMGDASMSHEFLVHVDVLLINQFPQSGDFADLLE